ncbi:MAG: DNA mismatch repair protein MutS [Planctomycetota bacterium]|nr:DNA mismatch repair protein MutS [Planctomycetota bacterium]
MSSDRPPTPAMQRYLEVKSQHPGTMLLFRIGDFYELFYEDAQDASRALGITLTTRDKGSTNPIPMAGFPYHQLDNYLRRLIQAGFRAAVCEQVEDPAVAKGIIRREVTRVVTPGTLTDDALLDPRESNFLACVVWDKERSAGLAWLELSTGRFLATELPPEGLADELARLQAAECLVPEDAPYLPALAATLGVAMPGHGPSTPGRTLLTERPPWSFAATHTRELLRTHFGVNTLAGFGWEIEETPAIWAAGALLEYVQETQKSALPHIEKLEPFQRGSTLQIDEATRRSLEVSRTLRDGQRSGSLLFAIDETVTAMGARLLADWVSNPLTDVAAIDRRLDAVQELFDQPAFARELREALGKMYDLARLTARVATGRASPRDLRFLANTLVLLPSLCGKLDRCASAGLRDVRAKLDPCADVLGPIDAALVEEPPLSILDGGVIRSGYHPQLDELRDLARGGKEWIARYQAEEIERTGIPSLKVGFNKVFGYYLEITAAQAAKTPIPPDYIRKQTLKNQERFITPQLKEHEEKVLRSEERSKSLEQELFTELRQRVAAEGRRLKQTAEALAQLDVLAGLAVLATQRNYCRPELTAEPILEIREGRHPVLDKLQPSGQFVPNDTLLGGDHGRLQIITGPNMAGKSTYIRQTALLTILAQIGSFVPAKSAKLGVADRIFARVGASDELSRGQSTFMVEMTETARILHQATKRSLVVLDEIGRGTSTYDGISLAWAVTEFLHDIAGSRTLFATHYHELTELSQTLPQVRNWNVAVREQGDGIAFLHKIVAGSADKSYGIHVARLAGIPLRVVDRARVILETLEADHLDKNGKPKVPPRENPNRRGKQLQLFKVIEHPVLDRIREMKTELLSPDEALSALSAIQRDLKENP